ncbi:MAG: ankyrin repeat domain-containing protein, partial [Eubacterium sp.]|nr:ankyrin repeat domain-containing protein [Eubacterium sp.]
MHLYNQEPHIRNQLSAHRFCKDTFRHLQRKYTPLHWSAYKGFDIISSILIKMGCNPLEVDSYGDNALHQAAAGNHYDTFKLFMGLGIDLDY